MDTAHPPKPGSYLTLKKTIHSITNQETLFHSTAQNFRPYRTKSLFQGNIETNNYHLNSTHSKLYPSAPQYPNQSLNASLTTGPLRRKALMVAQEKELTEIITEQSKFDHLQNHLSGICNSATEAKMHKIFEPEIAQHEEPSMAPYRALDSRKSMLKQGLTLNSFGEPKKSFSKQKFLVKSQPRNMETTSSHGHTSNLQSRSINGCQHPRPGNGNGNGNGNSIT